MSNIMYAFAAYTCVSDYYTALYIQNLNSDDTWRFFQSDFDIDAMANLRSCSRENSNENLKMGDKKCQKQKI